MMRRLADRDIGDLSFQRIGTPIYLRAAERDLMVRECLLYWVPYLANPTLFEWCSTCCDFIRAKGMMVSISEFIRQAL